MDPLVDSEEKGLTVSSRALFTNARHFSVLGGQFTSVSGGVNHITNYCTPTASGMEFRTIPLGDLNLQHEIRVASESNMVFREPITGTVRKLYRAGIAGGKLDLTVAMYYGEQAEEKWLQESEKYSKIRHPNILQIYAVAQSSTLYATVFHDGLIPLHEFRKWHSDSVLSTAYLEITMGKQFKDVEDHFGKHLLLASGKDQEPTLLAGLCMEEFPDIISHYSWAYTSYPLPRDSFIQLGAIDFHHESLPRETNTSPADSTVIAELLSLTEWPLLDLGWRNYNSRRAVSAENGWTRFSTSDLPRDYITIARTISMRSSGKRSLLTAWLMQANYIFEKFKIRTDFEAFKLISSVEYSLSWCAAEPHGRVCTAIKGHAYLFLCPRESLLGKDPSEFRHPESPIYYWSLDAAGKYRLEPDDMRCLGLPELDLYITYTGYSWSKAVYAAVRKFHRAKGFDPDTSEVPRHLGIAMYGVPRDISSFWLAVRDVPARSEVKI
ncbi:hypothetical protein C8R44DRAFT_989149 [Mycena epipterygia]|nr:hypothetical protein C8R44DRAFT_989149 [Mycena epipterygia]